MGAHSDVVLAAATIRSAVAETAQAIGQEYASQRPLIVGVLKGAIVFMADLVRATSFPVEVDFLAISPFGRGRVRIVSDLSFDIEGRHVIVVEDIVDTGLTLSYLLRILGARNPASLDVVALLDRPTLRLVEVPVKWRVAEIDERYVVGYGMDFEGRYRNLPDVRVVHDLAALHADPDLLGAEVFPPNPQW